MYEGFWGRAYVDKKNIGRGKIHEKFPEIYVSEICGIRDAFFVLLVRILLATMFFGQAMSLLYSLSGGILCLFAMLLVKLLLHGNYLFLASMTGAVFHNLGQIGVAFLLTSVPAVLVYLPFLLLSGLVTGLFIGLCARFTLRFLP